eukprot:6347004-Pyramimonas_sp.AAC.1
MDASALATAGQTICALRCGLSRTGWVGSRGGNSCAETAPQGPAVHFVGGTAGGGSQTMGARRGGPQATLRAGQAHCDGA